MTEKYFVRLEYLGLNNTIVNTLGHLAHEFKGKIRNYSLKDGTAAFSFVDKAQRDEFAQKSREMYLEEKIKTFCWDSQ